MYLYLSVRLADVRGNRESWFASRCFRSRGSLQVSSDRRAFLVPDPRPFFTSSPRVPSNNTLAVICPSGFSFRFAPEDAMTSEGYRFLASSSGNTMICPSRPDHVGLPVPVLPAGRASCSFFSRYSHSWGVLRDTQDDPFVLVDANDVLVGRVPAIAASECRVPLGRLVSTRRSQSPDRPPDSIPTA